MTKTIEALVPMEQRLVDFNGAEIMAVRGNDEKVYIGVKWVCAGIGLSSGQYQNQTRKLNEDVVLSKGIAKMQLLTAGGNQEVLCLELDFLPLWLAKINAGIVGDLQTQEKLIDYQLHAKDVLARAFLEKQPSMEGLSPQLQLLIRMELKQNQLETAVQETKAEVQGIRDVVALNPKDWRADTATLIFKMAQNLGGTEHIRELRNESYELLKARMGVRLELRLMNRRRRAAEEGMSKSKRDTMSRLDVIADDRKLVEGYITIIKEMAVKYGIAGRELAHELC